MSTLLNGKIILVTGASRGIGAAAAQLFAAEGATVVLTARNEDNLKRITAEIGDAASYLVADLARVPEIDRVVATVVERHGRLDGAFNNAAAGEPPANLAQTTEEAFDQVTGLNFKAVYFAVAAQVRAMQAAGGGAIVNCSSIGSLAANPFLPAYGAAKRAVNSLTASAAVEYAAEGIRVNAVAPGMVLTEMVTDWDKATPGVIDLYASTNPMGRPAQPEEIAEAAAWLLSDRASYVTGVVLPVTGGSAV